MARLGLGLVIRLGFLKTGSRGVTEFRPISQIRFIFIQTNAISDNICRQGRKTVKNCLFSTLFLFLTTIKLFSNNIIPL